MRFDTASYSNIDGRVTKFHARKNLRRRAARGGGGRARRPRRRGRQPPSSAKALDARIREAFPADDLESDTTPRSTRGARRAEQAGAPRRRSRWRRSVAIRSRASRINDSRVLFSREDVRYQCGSQRFAAGGARRARSRSRRFVSTRIAAAFCARLAVRKPPPDVPFSTTRYASGRAALSARTGLGVR